MSGDSTSSAFGQTLNFITTIKLKEVERQRDAFTKHANKVLEDAAATNDSLDRVSILLKGLNAWPGLSSASSSTHNLGNIERWLTQARSDPSIAPDQVSDWTNILETQLRHSMTRFDYAKLFGSLLTEWLGSGDSQATSVPSSTDESDALPASVKPSREEMGVQRDKIKELIFEPKMMDTAAIEKYLSTLFSAPDSSAALTAVRESLASFDDTLKVTKIDIDDLEWLIKSLLSRDLLSPEKAATTKSFLDNNIILQEVASVLNMQLESLDSWEWPEEGAYVEMRRHLSGKYRAYMDNEIITALLFQYIGMKWSVAVKAAFRSIVNSRAWKRDATSLTRQQLQRRKEQLESESDASSSTGGFGGRGRGRGRGYSYRQPQGRADQPDSAALARESIEAERREMQAQHFFMTQLPGELTAEDSYDAEPRPGEDKRVSANHAQQIMLRIVGTEAHLQRALHGQFTIMRADLEWFGPSLPHDSVLTVLKFFGLPSRWLTFFKKWLSPSLKFEMDAAPRMRKRGVPIAHCLSVLCGEAVLFGMDFAVNQRTGMYLYRIYDDFWFWHQDSKKCAAAWNEMQRYAKLVGITFNMVKTGGACVGGDLEPSLPTGTVGWGLLEFDAAQGRFVVSQEGVNKHITEMRHQLAATKSVFGFANAYNQYLGFMRRQFGEPAHCFGRIHADEIISSLERIQKELFADTNGSVVKRLQAMIEERFGIKDIPFGWFFFPIVRGGLEVRNPTVDYLILRDDLQASPEAQFTKELEKDKEQYAKYFETWNTSAAASQLGRTDDEFMPFEEYVFGRETHIASWGETYRTLQGLPTESAIVLPAKVLAETGLYTSTHYERWIAALYAEELFKRFGTLTIVESGLIPVGMVSMFKNAKVSWGS